MDDRLAPIPTIQLELYGICPDAVVQDICRQAERCYQALPGPLPETVNLFLFDTMERWRAYTTRRREESGVVTAGEEGFLATHEAWEGIPCLNVCLERLQAQPLLVQHGALNQVVAHSVLHGRPDYYRFQVPRSLIVASRARGLELDVLQQILYFVAIAVKGHEAVSLLVAHGFVQDQVALALHQLEVHEDDVVVWKMARWDPRARLLYLSAQLRPLLYLQPLLPYAPALTEASHTMLAHLPPEVAERLQNLVRAMSSESTGDTHLDVQAGLERVLNDL